MRVTSVIVGLLVAVAVAFERENPSLSSLPSFSRPRPIPVETKESPVAMPFDAGSPAAEAVTTTESRATRYASLPSGACLAELDLRHVEYVRVDRADVETPLRIAGPLSGVRFRTLRPPNDPDRARYEICDCRLVLALDDFAKILLRHGIVDVMYYSAFRPLVPGVAKRGHESALAMDIAFLGRADGTAYNILRDFTPIPGEHPCTPRIHASGPRELREAVCEAVTEGIFHVALTPDYDAAHKDHFHVEIVPGEVRSFAR